MTETEELEWLELENENALSLRARNSAGGDDIDAFLDAKPDDIDAFLDAAPGPAQPENGGSRDYSLFRSEFASPGPAGLPPTGANMTRAVLTNEPTKGPIEGAARAAFPVVGGLLGGGAGLAAGAPSGPGAVATTLAGYGLGGAGGEGVRQGLVQARSAALGLPYTSPGEVAGRMGIEGGAQAAAGGLGMAAGPVLRGLGRGLVNNPIARAVGNYSDDAARTLLDRPSAVIAKIGDEGATADAAQEFKGAIDENTRLAGESYRKLINQVVGPQSKYGPGFQLNVQQGVGDDLARIMSDYGIGKPGRIGVEAASGNRFLEFFRRANELTSASADDVYYLQRDLNNAIRSANDPTLKAALTQTKAAVGKYLERTVPEIGRANSIYAEATNLADELAGATNADDAARFIKSKLSGSGEIKQAILAAADRLPLVRKALEDLATAGAAKAFSPALAEIPRTGFFPGIAATGKLLGMGPAAAVGGTMGLAGASPRATAYVVRATQSAVNAIPSGSFAPALAGESSALAEAYMQRSRATATQSAMSDYYRKQLFGVVSPNLVPGY